MKVNRQEAINLLEGQKALIETKYNEEVKHWRDAVYEWEDSLPIALEKELTRAREWVRDVRTRKHVDSFHYFNLHIESPRPPYYDSSHSTERIIDRAISLLAANTDEKVQLPKWIEVLL